MKSVMKQLLPIVIFLAAACDHPTTQQALEGLQGGLTEAQKKIEPMADDLSQMTQEQLNKVMRFEYRVVKIPLESSSEQMEATLNALGVERWDCFSVIPRESGVTITCRRIPYALLRSALKLF